MTAAPHTLMLMSAAPRSLKNSAPIAVVLEVDEVVWCNRNLAKSKNAQSSASFFRDTHIVHPDLGKEPEMDLLMSQQ